MKKLKFDEVDNILDLLEKYEPHEHKEIIINDEDFIPIEDENIDIHHVDLCEVYNMINKNEIEDAKTTIGILLAKELI